MVGFSESSGTLIAEASLLLLLLQAARLMAVLSGGNL